MSRPYFRVSHTATLLTLVLLTLSALLSLPALADPVSAEIATKMPRFLHPLPAGFTMYLTFMGTGFFDWTTPHPEIPNCFQQVCPGTYFFDQILDLDQAEQEAWRQEALVFWQDRFGIDPEDPAWEGRVTFFPFVADPRNDIRAYSMAGARIHRQGWKVLDGGWLLVVTDPAGVELGGEFAGTHVEANTVFSHGKYLIQARTRSGRYLADIAIDYKARGPISFVQGIPWVGNCEIFRTTIDGVETNWGSGQAQPNQVVEEFADGRVKQSYRNILTYGAGSGFGEPYPD